MSAAATEKATLSGDVELPPELLQSGGVKRTLSGDHRDVSAARETLSGGGVKGTLSGDEPVVGEATVRPFQTLSGDGAAGTLSGDEPVVGEATVRPFQTLSGDGGARGTLSGGEGADPGGPPAEVQDGLSAFDYEVTSQLGKGGMGIVWSARQRSLERPVAVKTLRSELMSGPSAEKFAAEALVTGRLEHPNIPPVHAFGHDDLGRPYLCMKLVKGLEWGKLLAPEKPAEKERAAKMDLREHLEVIREVCDALSFAHAHGVIHRDLKPENVMVGEFGEVLVMDWGIALDLSTREERAKAQSGPRRPVGTPAYLPPEMALADEARMGPWTDVYLLGGMLYELLTGTPPHEGESILAVLIAAQRGDVEPPRERVKGKGREVPDALAEIAMRCLEADPQKRYQSAKEVAEAIDEYLRNEASVKISQAALGQLEKIDGHIAARSRESSEIYAGLAAVVADLRQAVKLWRGNRAASQGLIRARLSYASFALEKDDLTLAEAELAEVPASEPRRAELVQRIERRRHARIAEARRRRRLVAVVALLLVGVFAAVGKTIIEMRRADKSEAARLLRSQAAREIEGIGFLYETEQIEAYRRALAIDPSWVQAWSELGRAYTLLAYDQFHTDPVSATASLKGGIEPFSRAIALAQTPIAKSYADRAYNYEMYGEPELALADYQRARELEPEGHPGLEAASVIAFHEGRYREAETFSSRAIDVEAGETDYFRRGLARFMRGDMKGALDDARKAEKLSTRGQDEWYDTLMILALMGEGKDREAGERLLRALRFHPKAPHVMALLAYHAARQGDMERALAVQERARQLQASYARAFFAAAPVWRAARDAKPPLDQIGKALFLEVDLTTLTPKTLPRNIQLRRRGEERFARGEYELALSDGERALGDDPSDGSARLLRGLCFLKLGHPEQAMADFRSVAATAPNHLEDLEKAMAEAKAQGSPAGH